MFKKLTRGIKILNLIPNLFLWVEDFGFSLGSN